MPPGCAQRRRRVCTGYPQGRAHHELAVGVASGKLSYALATKGLRGRTQSRMRPGAGGGDGRVSVTEIAPRGGDFERTPPQDHYRPAPQLVHEVIPDLSGRAEPADAVTVA